MAKSRTIVSGPRWPKNVHMTTTPGHTNPGTLDADDEQLIFIGQVCWDDGASHDCDAIEFRTNSNTLVADVRVGLADIDTATGPPGRDDGTIDQYTTYSFNNPGAQNLNTTFTTGTSRTLAHGAQIAVVCKIESFTSGAMQFYTLTGGSNLHRPLITSFLGGAYALVTGNIPTFSLHATDGHYGVLKGGLPHLTAAPATVTIDSDTTIKRAALGFTVAAPVWGIEGEVFVTNISGGDITISVYDGTDLMTGATMTIDANTWGADAASRWAEFCFPDVAFVTGHTYYLSVVGASTACQIYTMEVTTDNRWDPITGAAGGGTVGYATFDASWSALDESVLPYGFTWRPIAVDSGGGGGGTRLVGGVLAG